MLLTLCWLAISQNRWILFFLLSYLLRHANLSTWIATNAAWGCLVWKSHVAGQTLNQRNVPKRMDQVFIRWRPIKVVNRKFVVLRWHFCCVREVLEPMRSGKCCELSIWLIRVMQKFSFILRRFYLNNLTIFRKKKRCKIVKNLLTNP